MSPLEGFATGVQLGAWMFLYLVGALPFAAAGVGGWLLYHFVQGFRAGRREYRGLALVAALVLPLAACEPCHRRHRRVTYVPEHWATDMGCRASRC